MDTVGYQDKILGMEILKVVLVRIKVVLGSLMVVLEARTVVLGVRMMVLETLTMDLEVRTGVLQDLMVVILDSEDHRVVTRELLTVVTKDLRVTFKDLSILDIRVLVLVQNQDQDLDLDLDQDITQATREVHSLHPQLRGLIQL